MRDALLGRDSKDADFLVPGVDIAGLRAALEPHGRTEELVVAGRPVGVRFYPRDPASGGSRARGSSSRRRAARCRPAPAGTTSRSSSTRPRPSTTTSTAATSRSTRWRGGSPTATLVDPLRRPARPRGADPAHRVADELRRGSAAASFAGFASSRSSISTRTRRRSSRCATRRRGVRLVSGERIGGGLAADGMGELSKLLLGAHPAKALAARARHRRARRAPAGVRAGDRVRPGEPLPRPDGRRAHVRGRPGGGRRRRAAPRPAGGALPRPRQAAGRLARDRRPAALLREARLLGDEPRAGQRRARRRGAAPPPLPERAAPARRAHRARRT